MFIWIFNELLAELWEWKILQNPLKNYLNLNLQIESQESHQFNGSI